MPTAKEIKDSIQLTSPLPADRDLIRVYDEDLISRIWHSYDNGALIKITKDDAGNIEIQPYPVVKVECPAKIKVDEEITITAQAEEAEGSEAVLYIDEEEQARGSMPVIWIVIFEMPGVYNLKVNAGNYGVAEREVVIE